MGLVYADIELINAVDMENARRQIIDKDEVKRMHLCMLVDSNACMMVLAASIYENFRNRGDYLKV